MSVGKKQPLKSSWEFLPFPQYYKPHLSVLTEVAFFLVILRRERWPD